MQSETNAWVAGPIEAESTSPLEVTKFRNWSQRPCRACGLVCTRCRLRCATSLLPPPRSTACIPALQIPYATGWLVPASSQLLASRTAEVEQLACTCLNLLQTGAKLVKGLGTSYFQRGLFRVVPWASGHQEDKECNSGMNH